MGSILTLRHPLGSGGALETRWDSLLSQPDSCPADGVHLRSRLFRRLRSGPHGQLVERYAARLVGDGLVRESIRISGVSGDRRAERR
jgi:hypothetical protein